MIFRTSLMTLLAGAALVPFAFAEEKSPFPVHTGEMGCVIEQVTYGDFNEYQVQGASLDGKWLSYSWDNGEDEAGDPLRGAYILNLETGEKNSLKAPFTNASSFSHDGRYLVGAQYAENGRTDIFQLELETGEVKVIAPDDQWDWLPSFSPDGKTILFNTYRVGGQAEMVLYDRASGELTYFTDDPRYDAHGEFSPDGSKVLFHRMMAQKEEGGYDFELFVYELSGGTVTQLTPGSPHEESYGSWASDSSHVVMSSDQNNPSEKHNLYVVGPDGEIVTRLTRGEWKDSYAYWTRDGQYIYFNSDRKGPTNVYRIQMDGLNCVKAR